PGQRAAGDVHGLDPVGREELASPRAACAGLADDEDGSFATEGLDVVRNRGERQEHGAGHARLLELVGLADIDQTRTLGESLVEFVDGDLGDRHEAPPYRRRRRSSGLLTLATTPGGTSPRAVSRAPRPAKGRQGGPPAGRGPLDRSARPLQPGLPAAGGPGSATRRQDAARPR